MRTDFRSLPSCRTYWAGQASGNFVLPDLHSTFAQRLLCIRDMTIPRGARETEMGENILQLPISA